MRKLVTLAVALALILGVAIPALACSGKSNTYFADCHVVLGLYQYASCNETAKCTGGHSMDYWKSLTVKYKSGGSDYYTSTSAKEIRKQVPKGQVGKGASASFTAECAGGYKFPKHSATDVW